MCKGLSRRRWSCPLVIPQGCSFKEMAFVAEDAYDIPKDFAPEKEEIRRASNETSLRKTLKNCRNYGRVFSDCVIRNSVNFFAKDRIKTFGEDWQGPPAIVMATYGYCVDTSGARDFAARRSRGNAKCYCCGLKFRYFENLMDAKEVLKYHRTLAPNCFHLQRFDIHATGRSLDDISVGR